MGSHPQQIDDDAWAIVNSWKNSTDPNRRSTSQVIKFLASFVPKTDNQRIYIILENAEQELKVIMKDQQLHLLMEAFRILLIKSKSNPRLMKQFTSILQAVIEDFKDEQIKEYIKIPQIIEVLKEDEIVGNGNNPGNTDQG